MPSLVERINNIKAEPAVKIELTQANWYNAGFLSNTLARNNNILTDDHYSYALAYLYIEPIRVACDKYAQAAGKVPYVLYQGDKLIARSDDTHTRHPFMDMLRNHRKKHYIGFFPAMIYEQLIYDELYIETLHPDRREYPYLSDMINGLRVLRGAAVSPNFINGKLQGAYYGGDDNWGTIQPNDLIYDKGYNSLSDYYGASRVQAVLDEANITNQFRRFLMRLLKKADRADVYASSKEEVTDAQNWSTVEKAFKDYERDPDKTVLAGSMPLDYTAIPRPDGNNQLEIDDHTRLQIFRGFSINVALVGDTSSTSYKDEHAAIYSNWVKLDVMYYLEQGDELLNDVLLPRMYPGEDLRIEHDLTEFDIVTGEDKAKIDAADSVLKTGAITYKQYLERIGEKTDDMPEQLLNCIYVEGVPVPLDEVPNLWRYKFQAPATEQLAQAQLNERQAQGAEAEADAITQDATVDTGESSGAGDKQAAAPIQYDQFGTPIPTSQVFGYHVDSGIVDVNEARAQLGLPPIEKESGQDIDLVQLNSQLQAVITAMNAGLSRDEAFARVGLDPPLEDEPIETVEENPLASLLPSGTFKEGKKAETLSSAYAGISFDDNAQLINTQRILKEKLKNEDIEWSIPATFHATLVYAQEADSDSLFNIVNGLAFNEFMVQSTGFEIFEGGEGRALVLRLADDPSLLELQKAVYERFITESIEVSEFSLPDAYKPHITLAYLPDGLDLPDDLDGQDWFNDIVCEVYFARDNYETFASVYATAYKLFRSNRALIKTIQQDSDHNHADDHVHSLKLFEPDQGTAEDELKAWRKVALKSAGKRDFATSWLAGTIEDYILEKLPPLKGDMAAIDQLFADALQLLIGRKSIRSIQQEFEQAFNSLLRKAMRKELQRTAWKRGMKEAVTEYGTRAYYDGMAEGGVEVSVSREEISGSDKGDITRLVREQDSYINGLADELFSKDGITDEAAERKSLYWFNKSIMPFFSAGLLSANSNAMMEFGGKDGNPPCPTCKRLKGQRHRITDWARKRYRPREDSDSFVCKGFHCQHNLFRVFAPARGSW